MRTFQAAADRAASTNANVVEFAGGEYVFASSAALDTSHSGLTFRATEGELVVFSSLVQVTGWGPSGINGNIQKAPLPAGLTHVRYVQDRSENWLERSATDIFFPSEPSPANNNEIRMYDPGVPQDNKSVARHESSFSVPTPSRASQYDLRVHQTDWNVNVLPITSVSGNEIFLEHPATYEMLATTDEVTGAPATEMWILNSLEGIDSPGEWAVIDGELYLWPVSGTGDIFVPTLTELVKVDAGGDGNTWSGTPVRDVAFEALTFTGLDYVVTGAAGTLSNPGMVTTQHDWGIVDGAASALRFRNAEDCSVEECVFEKSGSGGVRLDRHAQGIRVEACEFAFLGREAIILSGRAPGYGDVNTNNRITRCRITAPGREKWDCPAINVDQSTANLIDANYIEDVYMSALHLTSSRSVYLGFLAYENARTYFSGRESHFWQVQQAVIDYVIANEIPLGFEEATVEAHQFLYNRDNRFERNSLRNVHNMPTLSNGVLYMSGGTRHATNYITHNYFCDTQYRTQLFYVDSYLDDLDVRGNMVNNVSNEIIWDYNGWYQTQTNYGGRGRITANALQNSTSMFLVSGLEPVNSSTPVWEDRGNLLFNSTLTVNTPPAGSAAGSVAQLAEYVAMLTLLESQSLPALNQLSGVAQMEANLRGIVQSYDGLGAHDPGCVPSLNSSEQYAVLTLTGSGALGSPITARVSQAPPNQFGFFVAGPAGGGSYSMPPGSGSMLCVGQPIYRYNDSSLGHIFQTDAAGVGQATTGGGPTTLTTNGAFSNVPPAQMGQTWAFQAWFRENASPVLANFSNSRLVTF